MKKFTYECEITECHLDFYGHVNHREQMRILEEARWRLLQDSGYGLEVVRRNQLAPIVVDVRIRFIRELNVCDPIIVESKFIGPAKKLVTIEQKILKNKKPCTEAFIVTGLFDLVQRRLVPPTDEWRKVICGSSMIE